MKRAVENISTSYGIDVLAKAEEILTDSGVDHRFVGGAIANHIIPGTSVTIDGNARTAIFDSFSIPSLIRSDGSVRDLDAIGFSPHPETYEEARKRFEEERRAAGKRGLPYPPVSIEPTYYPDWPSRNRLLQLVSTLDVDRKGDLHLTFGAIDQPTPWETMEPWKMVFGNAYKLTAINLVGLPLRYYMRNPSGLKKKDQTPEASKNGASYSKVAILQKVADSVKKQGLDQGADYATLYNSWEKFIDTLTHHPDPLTY